MLCIFLILPSSPSIMVLFLFIIGFHYGGKNFVLVPDTELFHLKDDCFDIFTVVRQNSQSCVFAHVYYYLRM